VLRDFRVQGLGLRLYGAGFSVQGLVFVALNFGFRFSVYGTGIRF
jgi:hypothetical protein